MDATTVLDTNPIVPVHEASDLSAFGTGITGRTVTGADILTIDPAEVDIRTLSGCGDNATELIMHIRSQEAHYPALPSYIAEEAALEKGAVIGQASFARHPGGTGTIRLAFNGNNLAPNGDATVVEFTFSAAGLVDADLEDINAMLAELCKLHKDQALQVGGNLLEHKTVAGILEKLRQRDLSISNLHLENSFLTKDEAGLSSLLDNAILGGITPYEAALDAERIKERPALVNAFVSDIKLGGISGRIKNSRISGVDLTAGHIEVFTDVRSRIERISAIGATLAGEMNCAISGDFRRAVLGTKQQPLGGTAFQVHNSSLVPSRKISALVFAVATSDNKQGIVINQEFIELDVYKERKRFHTPSLESLHWHQDYFIQATIDTADTFTDTLSSFPEVEDRGCRKIAHGKLTAVYQFSENATEGTLPAVSLTVVESENETRGISIYSLLPERALYVLRQLDRFYDDQATLCYHNHNNEQLRWNDNDTPPKAAPRKKVKDTGIRLSLWDDRKTGVLTDNDET